MQLIPCIELPTVTVEHHLILFVYTTELFSWFFIFSSNSETVVGASSKNQQGKTWVMDADTNCMAY